MDEEHSGDKETITCPRCGQKLGVPRTTDVLRITCPNCAVSFVYPAPPPRTRRPTWLAKKIRNHPVFSGIILTLWVMPVARFYWVGLATPGTLAVITLLCTGVWLLGIWIMDVAKERDARYYKRWFVILLLFFYPLTIIGITLLWVASRFRKATKIVLTIVFGLLFIISAMQFNPEEFYYPAQNEIGQILRRDKGNIFLRTAGRSTRKCFRNEMLSIETAHAKGTLTAQQIDKTWAKSVVLITTYDEYDTPLGQGSGFVVTKEGGVVTNYHVVEWCHDASIKFADGRTYQDVSLVMDYPSHDIAILCIRSEGEQFAPVILGDSDRLEKGEPIVAIGNPHGLEGTISNGIVSGKREMEGVKLLQITAPVSSGSSGGALFNMKGEVIGITTLGSTWEAQNLNFAVPINSLKSMIREDF